MINSKSVSICNRFHARWANSGKITISKGGTRLWCPCSRGISSPSGTKLPRKKLETPSYHTVKTRSLYLTWPWIRTGSWRRDGQTDRIPIGNTRSQQYLPVQLSRVKTNNKTAVSRIYLMRSVDRNIWKPIDIPELIKLDLLQNPSLTKKPHQVGVFKKREFFQPCYL